MACALTALAAFVFARGLGRGDLPVIIGQISCVTAYLVGLVSCWCAAALYPKKSPMRIGWLALGANCFISVFRHVVMNPLFQPVAGSKARVDLFSQIIQLPAVICALVGILAIWWGVYRLGLGFRIRWFECAGVAVAAFLITWAFRDHLSHAQPDPGAITILQRLSLGLLLSIGGVGLLLHGLAMQMGGGRLAVVMRSVAVYALTRSVLTLWQENRESYSFVWYFFYYAAPWVFVFGAACFCWLADTVRRSIGQQSFVFERNGMR
jgi:hypothetical protein